MEEEQQACYACPAVILADKQPPVYTSTITLTMDISSVLVHQRGDVQMSENKPNERDTRMIRVTAAPEPEPESHFFQKLVISVGLVVGLAGLVMTILGIGGVGFTRLSFSNTVNLQTTSGGALAMVIGFGMATFLYNAMIRVDEKRAASGSSYGRIFSPTSYAPLRFPVISGIDPNTLPYEGDPAWSPYTPDQQQPRPPEPAK